MPRKTLLPDARKSPRYAGVCTFCRYPLLAQVAPENSPPDWAVYGVPFDSGVTYRPGARFGPRAIREESQYVKRYHVEHELDLCDAMSIADAGDAPVRPFSCEDNYKSQHEFATVIGDPGTTRLFAVGGDHSIALANIRATWERRGRPQGGLACVHFDSHLDTVDATLGEKYSHASPFIRAIQAGFINPARMLSIGIKGPLNTGADLDFAREHAVEVVSYEDWSQRDGQARIDQFVRSLAAGKNEVYLTFDVDCVDPAFAPGTGTPSVGGFTSAEALAVLRSLAHPAGRAGGSRALDIVGADVVEVLPDRDVSGITALLAAHVIFEVLCLDALNRAPRASDG
jgi:agmatinase